MGAGWRYAASLSHEEALFASECVCFKSLDPQIDIALGLPLFNAKDTTHLEISMFCVQVNVHRLLCQYTETNSI